MKEIIIEKKLKEQIDEKLNYMNGGAGGFICHCDQ